MTVVEIITLSAGCGDAVDPMAGGVCAPPVRLNDKNKTNRATSLPMAFMKMRRMLAG